MLAAASRALRSSPETALLPVIAITAHCTDPSWRERALGAGVVALVGEPVDFGELHRLLALVGGGGRARRRGLGGLREGPAELAPQRVEVRLQDEPTCSTGVSAP